MEKATHLDLGVLQWPDSVYEFNSFRKPVADRYLYETFYVVFVSGTFIPTIPQIARDLSTTPEMVG